MNNQIVSHPEVIKKEAIELMNEINALNARFAVFSQKVDALGGQAND